MRQNFVNLSTETVVEEFRLTSVPKSYRQTKTHRHYKRDNAALWTSAPRGKTDR